MKIKAMNVSKSYSKSEKLIENLSIELESDSIYGIVAPNGTGKTTFINLLAGFIKHESGIIEYEGNISNMDITIVYGGDKNLYMKNTVKENVYYFSILRGIKVKDIKNKIDYFKTSFPIYEKVENQLCEELSHGQKRLISIFCSIISGAKCIIFDEATEGLDKTNIDILKVLVKKIRKNRIIIIVSHDYNFVDSICDKKYYLINKQLIEGDSKLSVLENYNNFFERGAK